MKWRIKFYHGARAYYHYWDYDTREQAMEQMNNVMRAGIVLESPRGQITIVPPWKIQKIVVSPVRAKKRARTVVQPADLQRV